MPLDIIDYSNTVFYKIFCNDATVNDLYVGHTTNFVQRKYSHKKTCTKENYPNHNLKVYKCIRENGGWSNWRMDIIGFHDCYDHYEARKIEQNYFVTLHATLNSIEPLPKPKVRPSAIPKAKLEKLVWYCNVCNTTCQTNKAFIAHEETTKHKRNVGMNAPEHNCLQKEPKEPKEPKFNCVKCHYKCSNKKDYTKHLNTSKHNQPENPIKSQEMMLFHCTCGKKYKERSGLWRHKKKCNQINSLTVTDDKCREPTDNSTILGLIAQNKELMDMLREQNKIIERITQKVEII